MNTCWNKRRDFACLKMTENILHICSEGLPNLDISIISMH